MRNRIGRVEELRRLYREASSLKNTTRNKCRVTEKEGYDAVKIRDEESGVNELTIDGVIATHSKVA